MNKFFGIANIRKDWHITHRPILNDEWHGMQPLIRSGESLPQGTSKYAVRRMEEYLNDPHAWRMQVKQGHQSENALDLCVFAGAPVFVVDGNRHPCIMGHTPKLAEMGLPAFISPEQLYQELAMFVGNTLHPVEQPPSNMKDIEKVASHGFDKKISFRHRK